MSSEPKPKPEKPNKVYDAKLPNPVFNEDAQKQLWALRIKLANKVAQGK